MTKVVGVSESITVEIGVGELIEFLRGKGIELAGLDDDNVDLLVRPTFCSDSVEITFTARRNSTD